MIPPKDFTVALYIHTSRFRKVCSVLMNHFKTSICLLWATADISSCWIVGNPLCWYIALIYMNKAIAAIHHRLPQRPVAQNNLGSEETINISFEEKIIINIAIYIHWAGAPSLRLCLLCPMNPSWLLATIFQKWFVTTFFQGLKVTGSNSLASRLNENLTPGLPVSSLVLLITAPNWLSPVWRLVIKRTV